VVNHWILGVLRWIRVYLIFGQWWSLTCTRGRSFKSLSFVETATPSVAASANPPEDQIERFELRASLVDWISNQFRGSLRSCNLWQTVGSSTGLTITVAPRFMQYYAIMLARVSKNPVQTCTIKTQVDIPGTLPKGPKVSSLNNSCWEEEKKHRSRKIWCCWPLAQTELWPKQGPPADPSSDVAICWNCWNWGARNSA
jgi:hypothetical protein